ncbi:MAG: hypothetical protein KDB53_18295, partial [Planctomycetes bacterium]|nr:hypothetical protein [Planctomycetota bacterium]
MPYRVLLSVTLGLILFAAGTARSQSYLVSHFGAIADDGVDDTKAVVRALATLPEGSTLQFASGRYDFRSHDSRGHLNFIDMRHRHLRGATTGARTVFSFYDRTRPGVLMQRAADCSIEHVDLEYTQRPFTQGTIVATSSAGLFVDVQIAEGYPVPEVSRDTLLWSRAESLIAYEPLTRQIKTGGEQIRLRATNPVTRVSSTVLRMHFANATPLGPTEFNVQSGDLFALKCNLATIIVLRDSSQVVLRQLTITNSGSAAVASTYDDGAVMEFLDVVPAGDALLSVNRCGLHFKESRSGPIVRDSRFERTGDDAIAIASSWLEVLAVLAPRTVILGTKNNYVIEPRSHLRFQDGTNFSVLDECQTSGSTYLGYDPTIQRHRYQVELSFPTSAVAGDLAVRSDLLAVGFCIERNVIRDHRARGILVKGSHGQILDNDIDGSTLGGIVLGPEIDVFLEASFVEDVVIARNRIANVGLGRRPHISQSGAIVVTVRTPPSSGGGIDAVTRQNRRIVIQENTVRHSAYCG